MTTPVLTDPQATLKQHFGFDEFRTGQKDVIDRLLNGDSVLAVFPTGGGKSLCYQLPALMFDGLTVVVSPLIALMKDQIDQLQAKGIAAVRLDSSLPWDEYRSAMDQIRSGTAKMLYVAPERFFNERFRSSLDGVKISLFAIDEAHCISQWGHNFRPDYLKLAALSEKLNVERVLALTATATPAVQEDVCAAFDIAKDNAICTEFFRPNLHLRSRIVRPPERMEMLIDRLKSSPPGATIVYVSLQKTTEEIAAACQQAGLDAKAYHAGMESEDRAQIQEWFMNGENKIVVATIAFGMGIDKSDIRYIYHFNPPKSLENYAQEIGRAGRDGLVSHCELLLVPQDRITLENFVYGDTPSESSIKTFINQIDQQEDEFFIGQIKLGNLCNIRSLVVKTLLTSMELLGYLESTSPRYDSYTFKPNVPSTEILGNFSGEKQEFAKRLLACSKKKKIWFHLDILAAMEKLGCERSRIVRALDYFAEKGWIELRSSGLVHGYRKLKPITSVDELVQHFHTAAVEREKNEVRRTAQVVDLARATECQAALLSQHFGQPLEHPCGECSFCQNEGPFELPTFDVPQLPSTTIDAVKTLVAEHPAALDCSRSVTRFLCGMTSPALTRAKLSRHADFGKHSAIPFGNVMEQIENNISFANVEPNF